MTSPTGTPRNPVTFAGTAPPGSTVHYQMIIAGTGDWAWESAWWYLATTDPGGNWHDQANPGSAPYEARARATLPGGGTIYSNVVSFHNSF